jgi:hypothetical protein
MVEHPKGTESLTIHMVRVLSLWSSASGPLPMVERLRSSPYGRAPPVLSLWSSASGPLPMVERLRSLSVEPPKGTESLTIHMVRVLSLWSSASGPLPMVEPAYASLTVEPAYASLTVEPLTI